MSPHRHETRRRSTASAALTASWDHYLDTRGPRAHGDLLRAVDGFVRSEAARLLGRGHPLLEEVAQEALVGAARRIASDERPDYPAAYLRKIVNNKVADLVRRESRRRDNEQQQWTPEADEVDASVSAEWHDFLDTIRTIVSADEFWTLILRYHFDYSYGEIGDLLDKEPNAIRQIALRGRRKCREHLTRLEGRVPAWVLLPDTEPTSNETDSEGDASDHPGQREPRNPDPADRSRRPSAGSVSAPLPVTLPEPGPSRRGRRRLRPDGVGRPFGSPTTVVPLALLIALPVLFQVDRALDAAVEGTVTLTAEIIETDDGRPPSGPTISVAASTAPTVAREAPSTSARPAPTSPDPPTTNLATGGTTGPTSPTVPVETPTTRPGEPTTTTTSVVPTSRPTIPTTAAPTSRSPTTTTTERPTTTPATTTTTTTTPTTTSTTAPTTTTTTTGSTSTSSSGSTTSTTTGRDPGDGNDRPPDQ